MNIINMLSPAIREIFYFDIFESFFYLNMFLIIIKIFSMFKPLNKFLNNLRDTGSSIQCTVCRPCHILPELHRFFALVCHENRRMMEDFDAVCAIHCNR